MAAGPEGDPLPGVDEFVIASDTVVALAVKPLIIIPVLTLVSWLLLQALLLFSPLRVVTALEANELFNHAQATYGTATISLGKDRKLQWAL